MVGKVIWGGMTGHSSFQLTILFNDPDLDPERLDQQAQYLLAELKEMDEVEVSRVLDPNLPEGSKALGGFLVGMLTAEVSVENLKKLLGFLGDRLGGKQIELSVEGNGKKLTVKASSREELEFAIDKAKEFIG